MQSPRRHIVGLLALCTLIFVCTLFAFGIHQRAAETLSGLERDAAAAEPLTTDVRMNKREAKNALNFAFKWE